MQRGFSLLESVIYIALTAMIITVLITSTYQIIEGNSDLQIRSIQNEEMDFVIHKIDWVLNDVTNISIPSQGASGNVLEVSKNNYPSNSIRLEFSTPAPEGAGVLTLRIGNASATSLSNYISSIQGLKFERSSATSTMSYLKTTLNLNTDSFEIIKYFSN